MSYKEIKNYLYKQGYVFLPKLNPDYDTKFIAKEIGQILKISSFVGYENVSDVQVLKPREPVENNKKHKYSDNFGLEKFPLHTDLAHWLYPPRYLLLRCVSGSNVVSTKIINSDLLELETVKKAIVRTRNNHLLPIIFKKNGVTGIRWDSLFLIPMNSSSNKIKNFVISETIEKFVHHIFLVDKGDTVIIDNWMMLHGRSLVAESETGRIIERVYLSKLKEE